MEEKEIGSRGTCIPGGPSWIHQWNDKDKTEVDLRIARPRGYPEHCTGPDRARKKIPIQFGWDGYRSRSIPLIPLIYQWQIFLFVDEVQH